VLWALSGTPNAKRLDHQTLQRRLFASCDFAGAMVVTEYNVFSSDDVIIVVAGFMVFRLTMGHIPFLIFGKLE
jgi:hypothetical protein